MSAALDLADVVELAPWSPPAAGAPLREVAFRRDAWLPDEVERLRVLFSDDVPVPEIAADLGRPLFGVRSKLHELGMRRDTNRAWNELEDAELVRRYGTEPAARLAQDLGRSVSAVYVRAALHGLTQEQAPDYEPWEDAQIRAGYTTGVPVGQIAALIGRSYLGVVCRAGDLGVRHKNKPEDWSDEETAQALELANEGHEYSAIIETLIARGFPRRSKAGFGPKLRAMGYGRGWGRAWTPDEDELLQRAYLAGDSLTPLQERLGRTVYSIRWRAKTLGLSGTHVRPRGFVQGETWSEDHDQVLRDHYATTKGAEVAKMVGRPLRAVYQRAFHLGLKNPWMRAFSPEEERAIGVAWRTGVTLKALSAAMDRDMSVVAKKADRMGLKFTDPARPIPSPRGAGAKFRGLTLADILARETAPPASSGNLFRLADHQRGVLLSAMSDESAAFTLQRSPGWVARMRRELAA